MGAVDVAWTQSTAFEIAELVEDKQRVIAAAAEMAVISRPFLVTMGRARMRSEGIGNF
jgi:hypothetical protein